MAESASLTQADCCRLGDRGFEIIPEKMTCTFSVHYRDLELYAKLRFDPQKLICLQLNWRFYSFCLLVRVGLMLFLIPLKEAGKCPRRTTNSSTNCRRGRATDPFRPADC